MLNTKSYSRNENIPQGTSWCSRVNDKNKEMRAISYFWLKLERFYSSLCNIFAFLLILTKAREKGEKKKQ